jgi:hypothetical protein
VGARDKVGSVFHFIGIHGEAAAGAAVTSPSAPLGKMGKDVVDAAMWGLLSGNRRLGSKASMMRNMLL